MMYAEIAENKDGYKTFYEQFGKYPNIGVHEELLRYHT